MAITKAELYALKPGDRVGLTAIRDDNRVRIAIVDNVTDKRIKIRLGDGVTASFSRKTGKFWSIGGSWECSIVRVLPKAEAAAAGSIATMPTSQPTSVDVEAQCRAAYLLAGIKLYGDE